MPATREELFAFLDKLGIAHKTVEHAAAHTVAEAQVLRGELPGGHAKNLFLKCKKGQLYLLVAEENTQIKLNHLHKRIGSGRLSFGSAELMQDVLGISPGSVTPLALINDRQAQRVSVILDDRLMQEDPLNFHPLDNRATTTIRRDDLMTFIKACGHDAKIMDVTPEEKSSTD
jgi:Ala-tRNA(Pro) deacylase